MLFGFSVFPLFSGQYSRGFPRSIFSNVRDNEAVFTCVWTGVLFCSLTVVSPNRFFLRRLGPSYSRLHPPLESYRPNFICAGGACDPASCPTSNDPSFQSPPPPKTFEAVVSRTLVSFPWDLCPYEVRLSTNASHCFRNFHRSRLFYLSVSGFVFFPFTRLFAFFFPPTPGKRFPSQSSLTVWLRNFGLPGLAVFPSILAFGRCPSPSLSF